MLDKNFGLFLTRGLSLEKWQKIGSLTREIKLYRALAGYFNQLYIFSYGCFDTQFHNLFPPNVIIIDRPKYLPVFLYSWLLPFWHFKILRTINFYKTNQMDGSWSAVIAKIFNPQAKLIIRCGYEWLWFIIKNKKWLKKLVAFWVEKMAYKSADKIILTSLADKDFVIKTFKISSNKILVIPNFVDTDIFKPLNLPKQQQVIFVGRLESQKNLINLFKAFAGLTCGLVIVGEGSQRGFLEALALKLNLSVKFLGNLPQTELVKVLNQSQIFILPSYFEGNPKTLLEAMACGLACVGTNVSGINNVITDQYNGVLCETDVLSIKNTILNLLNNQTLQTSLAQMAAETVKLNNAFGVCFNQEFDYYKNHA